MANTFGPMLRKHFLGFALLLLSTGVFLCSTMPVNGIGEELTKTTEEEKSGEREMTEFDPAIMRAHHVLAMDANAVAAALPREVVVGEQHVGEVPVQPPEAIC